MLQERQIQFINKFPKMSTKENEKNLIKNRLHDLWSFMEQYLPLANSQACDFIVDNLWEEIPSAIQEELLATSDSELASLPSRTASKTRLQADATEKPIEVSQPSDSGLVRCPELKTWTPSYSQADGNEQKRSLGVSMWKHSTLDAFVEEAGRHILDARDLTTSADLRASWSCDTADGAGRLPGVLMSQKKCHEVDVMAELCEQLAKSFSTNLTVDLGSGKGYLSTQLCCEFGHRVIGIDAAQTNTAGATKRRDRLAHDWKSCPTKSSPSEGCDEKSKEKHVPLLKILDQDILIPSAGAILNLKSDDLISKLNDLKVDARFKDTDNSNNAVQCTECDADQDVSASFQKAEDVCDALGASGTESEKINSTVFSHAPETGPKEQPKNDAKSNWSDKFIPLTKFVDPDMNLINSVRDAAVKLQLDPSHVRILLTGLHTCGGLGASILKMFVNSESASVLCSVACCYNLLEEEFVSSISHTSPSSCTSSDTSGVSHFPMSSYLRQREVGLGKSARNVACLSVHRMASEGKLQGYSFYPRALLQKIIVDRGASVKSQTCKLRKVQKKSKSLYEYVKAASLKMGLQTDGITPDLVESYDRKYGHVQRQLAAFVQLRAVLAPCIESFILLDRYLYLLEQDCVKDVHLSKVFDPVMSPRCYALIAIKKSI